jgi:uroporphyrinogen III methyltransferase/synthase
MGDRPVIGTVHLVGAGPGDPELITVKGRRLLAAAEAVVHDRLIGTALLELIPPDALRIDVGKTGYRHAIRQPEINAILVRLARRGLDVVRLKGGDPFVFGRGGEEAKALRAAGIPFEVVPGITAGIAGPALAGIPITHRGLARSVAFVTGHEDRAGGGPIVDWDALARIDTVVVFMGGRTAPAVARRLLANGRQADTPAAVVIEASLDGEEVRFTDLGTLADDGPGELGDRPALLVIGDVVRLGQADQAGQAGPLLSSFVRELAGVAP